jgi:putative transposase
MARGNRRQTIFEDDQDRRMFIDVVDGMVRRYAIRVYELCEMGNHYHAILDAPRENLSIAMRFLNGEYAQASNRRHERRGHLFEERFTSVVVQWLSYLRRASRYVVRNPVRAKLCATVDEWPWSTFRSTAGLVDPPRWHYREWLLEAYDTTSLACAQQRYRDYVNAPTVRDKPLDKRALAWGTARFQQEVRERLGKRDNLPRVWKVLGRPSLGDIFTQGQSRAERNYLIQVAHETHGYFFSDIAKTLELHPSSVSAAYRRAVKGRRGVLL